MENNNCLKLFKLSNGLSYKDGDVDEIPIDATNALCVHPGHSFDIYSFATNQKLWISGLYGFPPPFGNVKDEPTDRLCFSYTHFEDSQIAVNAICCTPVSKSLFFIPDNHGLYAAGENKTGLLGLNPNGRDNKSRKIPEFSDQIRNVIDVQPAECFAIALCISQNSADIEAVTAKWSHDLYQENDRSESSNENVENKKLPQVIMSLITEFVQETVIYSTTNYPGSGLADNMEHCGWTRITHFDEKQSVQIAVGERHSLFLEDNGRVWSCGHDMYGHRVLGLGDFEMEDGLSINEYPKMYFFYSNKLEQYAVTPREMKYFSDRGIKIKSIACGQMHSMALTDDGTVYSWGCNRHGQCGHGEQTMVEWPQMIEMTKDLKVTEIQCGFLQSYFKTECGGHYLFGLRTACVMERTPRKINEYLMERCNAKEVVSVWVGKQNIHVLCSV